MHGVGGNPWAICDRCGCKRRLFSLKREWTGFMVCGVCHDPRPAELTPPVVDPREGAPLPGARPRPPDVFLTDSNPVNPEDL
jgi:hypothetical protein